MARTAFVLVLVAAVAGLLALGGCGASPGAGATAAPTGVDGPAVMPGGTPVFGPSGWYDYCRRHREDDGCPR